MEYLQAGPRRPEAGGYILWRWLEGWGGERTTDHVTRARTRHRHRNGRHRISPHDGTTSFSTHAMARVQLICKIGTEDHVERELPGRERSLQDLLAISTPRARLDLQPEQYPGVCNKTAGLRCLMNACVAMDNVTRKSVLGEGMTAQPQIRPLRGYRARSAPREVKRAARRRLCCRPHSRTATSCAGTEAYARPMRQGARPRQRRLWGAPSAPVSSTRITTSLPQ